mmetsp:Transcript_59033/g.68290  ORF Transcript_59033/g.68290 Transcript_59033/m.68290 type:complete len:472 (-) Transcript_59033:131-1546(-)
MKHIGLDAATSMTRDGQPLDATSGLPDGLPPHMFSAPSKESLHVAVLCKVLEGVSDVANATYTVSEALDVLEAKVSSFERFNTQFPGFGGFFPWVAFDGNGSVTPTWDWQNRVPALDNGELFWAAFAVADILNRTEFRLSRPGLAERWAAVWQRMVANAVTMFYAGNGNFRTVTSILNQSWPVSNNTYTGAASYLNDPYEGELFTVMVYLLSPDLNATEKELLWVQKRAMLQRTDLPVTNCVDGSCSLVNITVQRGFWFSAHEQWKYLMLPYDRSETNYRVFLNGERARTWYAFEAKQSPGLWASVNGPIPNNSVPFPYFSDCGVGPIAFEEVLHDDVVTPYGMFSLYLASPSHGAAWLHHMIDARRGQNCYGTTEAFNITGTEVSPLTTWDSKITTLVATSGGLASTNEAILDRMGLLDAFSNIIETEWSRVFSLPLSGEALPYRLPERKIPRLLDDFTSCTLTSPSCTY